MAKSPLPIDSTAVGIDILIDGKVIEDHYEVTFIQVEREVNSISNAKIGIADGNLNTQKFEASESASFLPGKQIEIKAGYDSKRKTIFKGIILRHRIHSNPSARSELQVFCSDEAVKMTLGRKNRNLEKEKDSGAISKIIKENGLKAKVSDTPLEHPNIVQYYSTDWDFVLSRAEMNGMIVTTKDGEVTVEPPKVSGAPVLKLTYGLDVYSFDLEMDAQEQMTDVTCRAWDSQTLQIIEEKSQEPSVNKQGNVSGKKLSDTMNISDFQLQSTSPIPKGMLREWANAELLKARMSRIKGRVEFPGSEEVYPDTLVELAGFGPRFDGEGYVSGIHHTIRDGVWTTEASFGLSAQWFIAETPNVNALPAAGMLPGIEGIHNGTVKKTEGDPDGATRILVDIPIIEPSGKGVWARMAHLYATENAGSFFLPEIGDEVVLGFLNNDPRYPVILGMLYGKKKKAPLTPAEKNETKAIVTKAQLKITFDEKKKDIIIETPKGNKVTLSDEEGAIRLEDSNKNKIVLDNSGITLDSAKDINLKAQGNISLAANAKITLDAKADVAIAGLNIKNSAKVAFSAEGKALAELKAAGQTTVKGAMVMIN